MSLAPLSRVRESGRGEGLETARRVNWLNENLPRFRRGGQTRIRRSRMTEGVSVEATSPHRIKDFLRHLVTRLHHLRRELEIDSRQNVRHLIKA